LLRRSATGGALRHQIFSIGIEIPIQKQPEEKEEVLFLPFIATKIRQFWVGKYWF